MAPNCQTYTLGPQIQAIGPRCLHGAHRHSLHAIAAQLAPAPGCTGIDALHADTFTLHCFQVSYLKNKASQPLIIVKACSCVQFMTCRGSVLHRIPPKVVAAAAHVASWPIVVLQLCDLSATQLRIHRPSNLVCDTYDVWCFCYRR